MEWKPKTEGPRTLDALHFGFVKKGIAPDNMNYFRIKEHSFIARLAAGKLRSKNVAMVIGRTIYLYGTTGAAFLADERWVRHELKHIEQYQRYGMLRFLFKYLAQSIKYGYYNCPLEKEARAAETDTDILARFKLKKNSHAQV